jgi:formylglycine-generating enzyme required for sulfatase activity
VRNVTAEGAIAFCRWLCDETGRLCRLPTEAEWEFAAKGREGRTYPWGETPQKGNPYGSHVGANPHLATPDGVHDLNGPVYQYCADMFNESFYQTSPVEDPVCTNGFSRVVRGGPMFMFMEKLQMPPTWKRFRANENEIELHGFRIVIEALRSTP